MTKISALLSDADGTLIDSVLLVRHGLYEAARKYLTHHGVPARSIPSYEQYQEELLRSIGGSARESLERIVSKLYAKSPHHIKDIDYDELNALLDPIQDELVDRYVKEYDGLAQLLAGLGRDGLRFAVVTSATNYQIVRNLAAVLPELECTGLYRDDSLDDRQKLRQLEGAMETAFGIDKVAIITHDHLQHGKPYPEGMLLAMKRLDVPADECAALGDHNVDMEAAESAGIPVRIGVTHGFGEADKLRAGGATAIIDSLDELSSSIMNQLNTRRR